MKLTDSGTDSILGDGSEEEGSFWMSYGDLFAGLLMVFALLLLTALYFYQSGVDGVREILLVRQEIVDELQDAFAAEEGRIVNVDADGVVRFRDGLLFEQNSFEILPAGQEQIEAFTRQYLGVIMERPEFQKRITRIIVEGHTNDDGEYFYNLRLSQDRAYAVMSAIIGAAEDEHVEYLVDRMTAVGRSFADLLYVGESGEVVDRDGSRRIEIRFDLDDRSVLELILATVFRE